MISNQEWGFDMEYYHNLTTQKSFEFLKSLQRNFKFILIGGWAVFLWTKSLKSKDIDIVVDFGELQKFKAAYELSKNERLNKYEIKIEEIDIDVYVTHYSNPGLPAEELAQYSVTKEGFITLRPEVLLILKQAAHEERQGTPKGEKDKIDIISLLTLPNFDYKFYKEVLGQYQHQDYTTKLKSLLSQVAEIKELGLNRHKFSQFKKVTIARL